MLLRGFAPCQNPQDMPFCPLNSPATLAAIPMPRFPRTCHFVTTLPPHHSAAWIPQNTVFCPNTPHASFSALPDPLTCPLCPHNTPMTLEAFPQHPYSPGHAIPPYSLAPCLYPPEHSILSHDPLAAFSPTNAPMPPECAILSQRYALKLYPMMAAAHSYSERSGIPLCHPWNIKRPVWGGRVEPSGQEQTALWGEPPADMG